MTCKTCDYAAVGNGDLVCRVEPPKPFLVPPQKAGEPPGLLSVWPTVRNDQWCGKHPERVKRALRSAPRSIDDG